MGRHDVHLPWNVGTNPRRVEVLTRLVLKGVVVPDDVRIAVTLELSLNPIKSPNVSFGSLFTVAELGKCPNVRLVSLEVKLPYDRSDRI